ncbi:hypothetical protein [Flexivirga meconopsidis]|uniref:hypothetical protein n=1 Tax=Flexivirga meconopsidis TaxID=2977121 RepID=UPI00223F3424|nr:hypothetical protein [Flexivirga meconopsidis]
MKKRLLAPLLLTALIAPASAAEAAPAPADITSNSITRTLTDAATRAATDIPATATDGRATIAALGTWAENSVRLPNGHLIVTTQSVNEIDPATGEVTTLTPDYGALLGGIVVQGNTLYYLVGNGGDASSKPIGTLMALDLRTRQTREVLTGFNQVNGLVGLPDGSLAFTVILGDGAGVWRTDPAKTTARRISSSIRTPDGITAIGNQLYVSAILKGEVWKVDADTGATTLTANWVPLPDDLTAMPDGYLYQATEAGPLWKIDPATGRRTVQAFVVGATSAKPYDTNSLTVTDLFGNVQRLPI